MSCSCLGCDEFFQVSDCVFRTGNWLGNFFDTNINTHVVHRYLGSRMQRFSWYYLDVKNREMLVNFNVINILIQKFCIIRKREGNAIS